MSVSTDNLYRIRLFTNTCTCLENIYRYAIRREWLRARGHAQAAESKGRTSETGGEPSALGDDGRAAEGATSAGAEGGARARTRGWPEGRARESPVAQVYPQSLVQTRPRLVARPQG